MSSVQPSLRPGPESGAVRRRDLLAAAGVGAGLGITTYFWAPRGKPPQAGPEPTATTASTGPSTTPTTTAPTFLDVRDAGARGDAQADDSAAFRAALGRSLRVRVPAGTYRLRVAPNGHAIDITRAGTVLRLEPGAMLVLDPTGTAGSAIIAVSAPDVRIEGGSLVGDLAIPQSRIGEWGHGILLARGADRAVLSSVTVGRCWGDGFYIGGGVADVTLLDCTADSNRRQGLSIVHAVNPLVSGGRFVNTGMVGQTAPSAGIDVEPNPLRGQSVTGARIRNVVVSGNRGPGLLVVGVGGPVELHASGVVARRNAGHGFTLTGPQAQVSLSSCLAELNHTGYVVGPSAAPLTISASQARANSAGGFVLQAPRGSLDNCEATGNAGSGFEVRHTSSDSALVRCRAKGN